MKGSIGAYGLLTSNHSSIIPWVEGLGLRINLCPQFKTKNVGERFNDMSYSLTMK